MYPQVKGGILYPRTEDWPLPVVLLSLPVAVLVLGVAWATNEGVKRSGPPATCS